VVARHGDFGFPVVVKPVREGSSIGVAVATTPQELEAACEHAFCFDDEVLVERFVSGTEVSVAVLGDRALGAVEVVPRAGLFDYAAKHGSSGCACFIPPRLSPERYRGLLTQAVRAHQALGCEGATRVDMIVSETGNELILEVNTVPELTPRSLLPQIAAAAGVGFADLVEAILLGAELPAARRGRRPAPGDRLPQGDDLRREPGVSGHH
jgi:D-alanine-D-alanine ligase